MNSSNNGSNTDNEIRAPAWFKEPIKPFYPTEVRVRYRGDSDKAKMEAVEAALSKFKKVLEKDGVMSRLKETSYFKSPGRKRYEKHKEAEYKRALKKKKFAKGYKRRRD